jgi:distribution and morphology protein 31
MTTITNTRAWSRIWDPGSRFLSAKNSTNGYGSASSSRHFSAHTAKRSFCWSKPRSQKAAITRTSATTKSFASCGFLFVNSSTNASTTPSMIQCAATVEKSLYSNTTIPGRSIASISQQVWRREIHTTSRRRRGPIARGNTSSSSNGRAGQKITQNENKKSATPPPSSTEKPGQVKDPSASESHGYLHLPHLPQMPHRPTREELLAAATGFWSRLKVRFKWFSIRSTRPWNIDDWSAFASWFVLGNIVWVFVGTTTFFSLVIFSINTVFAQGKL